MAQLALPGCLAPQAAGLADVDDERIDNPPRTGHCNRYSWVLPFESAADAVRQEEHIPISSRQELNLFFASPNCHSCAISISPVEI
jgi:hypothetical protein